MQLGVPFPSEEGRTGWTWVILFLRAIEALTKPPQDRLCWNSCTCGHSFLRRPEGSGVFQNGSFPSPLAGSSGGSYPHLAGKLMRTQRGDPPLTGSPWELFMLGLICTDPRQFLSDSSVSPIQDWVWQSSS